MPLAAIEPAIPAEQADGDEEQLQRHVAVQARLPEQDEEADGIGDASPFLDALTTVLSVEAQYLMTRKVIEHWWIWMAADIIYIYLYASRNLYLTSLLYVVFFAMCVVGLRDWLRDSAAQARVAA